jgi:hypothetical protein
LTFDCRKSFIICVKTTLKTPFARRRRARRIRLTLRTRVIRTHRFLKAMNESFVSFPARFIVGLKTFEALGMARNANAR